ncbi:MAG TPA: hypothetical protein VFM98_14800 [Ramlibacter sp.]|uniref:hypothetical protein n=1 Tax=Ramlibacter sp. TaxID=1917967 RepID=UPI002D80CB5A|nr:hypothetical protein [Ramlibacter sp.]HET8746874.1 hypothetical protein [Ramlibacter sp.]
MARQRDARTKSGTLEPENWVSRLPVPEAHEGGDSAWDLWHEASKRLDLAFAPTEPSSVVPVTTEGGCAEELVGPERPHLLSVHTLMVLARRNNRVCPLPAQWAELYRLLGGDGQPELQAPPLQPWLWTRLSGLQKRLRFREHVEWAERHGRLELMARFMGGLEEGDWVHMGEES